MTHARAAARPERSRGQVAHPIARLQRTAGNRAVQTALAMPTVQRQLKATGSNADITALLQLLQKAAGMTLTHDGKSKLVSAAGKPVKPLSAELASRLQAIIADTTRTAQVALGRTKEGVWFGEFPSDAAKRIQELRIDHFLALEQAVPGAGVATLAHEIVENYEAQAVKAEDWGTAFDVTHEQAMVAETKILDELQAAHGQSRSGARLHTHIAVVPGTGKRGKNRTLHIEAHEVDFIVFEVTQVRGRDKMTATRTAAKSLGAWRCRGFTKESRSAPKGAEPTLQKIADLLSNDPTAAVVLRATADAKSPGAAPFWYHALEEAIRDRMAEDVILRSWRRFNTRPAMTGTPNQVEITVRRPDLP